MRLVADAAQACRAGESGSGGEVRCASAGVHPLRPPLLRQSPSRSAFSPHPTRSDFGPSPPTPPPPPPIAFQHNLRVIAKAYSRVTFPRLCSLLGLEADTTEAMLAELVSDGTLYAKVDRPAGVVAFARPQPPVETLRAWASDIAGVLNLLETTTHLIQKEAMVHGVTLANAPVRS